MRKSIVYTVFIILMAAVLSSCSANTSGSLYEKTEIKMDTSMTIRAYGTNAEEAVNAAFQRIDGIEQLTSLHIDTSDVARVNKASGKSYEAVSPEVYEIVSKAVEYSRASGGAFDITIGPVMQLWGLGTKDARVPSPQEIADKLSLVGYDKIRLDDAGSSIMMEKEGMVMDLGGIAKGYAADQAVDVLKKYGIKRAVINLGGSSIYAMGSKDGGRPWSIGLQHPRKDRGEGYLAIARLHDSAVATSGDYERYIIENGRRYHHILDPKTGYPADSDIMSDSIIIDGTAKYGSMDVDIISTVVFVLGAEKGMEFAGGFPGVQYMITTDDNKLIISDGMKNNIDSISEDFQYDKKR